MSSSGLDGQGMGLAEVERRRVQALVAADLSIADELHASDFQLITPGGVARSKSEYLARIASGETNYQLWEPGEISVRVRGDLGCVRYCSTMTVIVGGHVTGPRQLWHTDLYEKRNDLWQVVTRESAVVAGRCPLMERGDPWGG